MASESNKSRKVFVRMDLRDGTGRTFISSDRSRVKTYLKKHADVVFVSVRRRKMQSGQ